MSVHGTCRVRLRVALVLGGTRPTSTT